MKRVVVTGLGMINSVGQDKEESFSAILNGECGIKHIKLFDANKFSVKIAGRNYRPLTQAVLWHAKCRVKKSRIGLSS